MSKGLFQRYLAPHQWVLAGFLLFYLFYIGYHATTAFNGDEPRYLRYAHNLTQGYYAEGEDPEFLSGPGYPLFLAPFVALDLPLIVPKLANALLLVGALWFFFLTLRPYLTDKQALWAMILLGLHPLTFKWSSVLFSESFALFLNMGFILAFTRSVHTHKTRDILLAALSLGMLILTKVIFAYVVLGTGGVALVSWLIFRWKVSQRMALIAAGAFVVCLPYLAHTYAVTGKFFYWSTSGGEILYYHASPFPDELGSWFVARTIFHPETVAPDEGYRMEELAAHHLPFYKTLPFNSPDSATCTFSRDQRFKAQAMVYIREHPEKFLRNSAASLMRLFFETPNSHTPQNLGTAKYLLPNMFLVVLAVLLAFPAIRAYRQVPLEIWALITYLLMFIGGISLLNGNTRHLIPNIPIFVLFISFGFCRLLEIRIRPPQENKRHI